MTTVPCPFLHLPPRSDSEGSPRWRDRSEPSLFLSFGRNIHGPFDHDRPYSYLPARATARTDRPSTWTACQVGRSGTGSRVPTGPPGGGPEKPLCRPCSPGTCTRSPGSGEVGSTLRVFGRLSDHAIGIVVPDGATAVRARRGEPNICPSVGAPFRRGERRALRRRRATSSPHRAGRKCRPIKAPTRLVKRFRGRDPDRRSR